MIWVAAPCGCSFVERERKENQGSIKAKGLPNTRKIRKLPYRNQRIWKNRNSIRII